MEEIYEDRLGNRCRVSGLMAWAMHKEREWLEENTLPLEKSDDSKGDSE